jgi:hypothetical protein
MYLQGGGGETTSSPVTGTHPGMHMKIIVPVYRSVPDTTSRTPEDECKWFSTAI